jgi:(1->4)-alpha-D-glucan 1-alpha-D-glucosylmutase
MRTNDDVREDALGIETHYVDQSGHAQTVPRQTVEALRAILATPGRAGSGDSVLDPVVVLRADRPLAIPVHGKAAVGSLRWKLVEEDGTVRAGTARLRSAGNRRHFLLPQTPALGYHRLSVAQGRRTDTAEVIVVPGRAFQPAAVHPSRADGGRGAWGLAVQLYGLRSERNWGIGDFTDLATLIDRAAPMGAQAIGLNPLHALFPDQPELVSPYSPSSRLFLNTLYLDVEAIPDFAECEAARTLAATPEFAQRLAQLRAEPLVAYDGVATCKRSVLALLYESFRQQHLADPQDGRGQAFRDYQRRMGAGLRRFATFQALRAALSATDPRHRSWRHWPDELRTPSSPAVDAFAEAHLMAVEHHEYLQWQADLQLATAAERARITGLGIGLYQDLAVGFDPDGADAWSMQDVLVPGWSIGAPPDAYNLNGQDWGLLPQNPGRLRGLAYRPFLDMLRANMRHAGALRIDHVLGLKRLFWVPHGDRPAAGAYVRYPFDDLLGLVALESVRNRCLIVGEDLGTVPEGFRAALNDRGIFSYEVLYFARDSRGVRPPRRWPKEALGAVSTHDLPPLQAFWTGADIDLRAELALYPDDAAVKRDRIERAAARRDLASALRSEGLAAAGDAAPVDAVHRFLARTASRLVMAQIEDLVGQVEPVNVPGTVTEHPNWRRKLPDMINHLFDDATVVQRLNVLREERPPPAAPELAPRATYRLQLHKGFTFRDAEAVLPYLRALGISHVYVSPILEAQAGSTHGYDTASFERLNPELGGAEGFAAFSQALRRLGLKLLVDFVPNHMGIGGTQNTWWLDVLEWGPGSPYAGTFDIDWAPLALPGLAGRLLVPLLGDDEETVLKHGELELRFDAAQGSFDVWYHDNRFPLRPADYPDILAAAGDALPALPLESDLRLGDRETGRALKRRLAELAQKPAMAEALRDAARRCARRPGALAGLLDRQFYKLASWRAAAKGLNYRRFFDINQLAAIRMEDPEVFQRCHALIGRLIATDQVHGLRLDHVDGLTDPAAYGRDLRRFVEEQRAPSPSLFPIVVEKILAADERLRLDWAIEGTTGYEFTNLVNALFIDPAGAKPLDRIYAHVTGHRADFDRTLHQAKLLVIESLFGGELTALTALLARLAAHKPQARRYSEDQLRLALRDLAAGFSVYRTYVSRRGATADDRRILRRAAAAARRHRRSRDSAVLGFVEKTLSTGAARPRDEALRFAARFQQFTAPVMAKSLEDTTFYRDVRLLSLNEVGGDPRVFGTTPAQFHRHMSERHARWPHSLLATATHDTKRGEDARLRLDVLSEIPDLWARHVARWRRLNRALRTVTGDGPAPSPNDEYLIYQTLVGAWPFVLTEAGLGELSERLKAYVVKATREAKEKTSWHAPNQTYEAGVQAFVEQLLLARAADPFRQDFVVFHALVARLGALNSLSQTVLKLTLPGVPDIYQGCELWDLSLVDPDNRRPVDFRRRRAALAELTTASRGAEPGIVHELAASWRSGALKLHLIAAVLAARRSAPQLFGEGSYEPLAVRGPAAQHVVAFARRTRRETMIVAVGRWFARLAPRADELSPAPEAWAGTTIALPARLPAAMFRNVLSGLVMPPPPRGGLAVQELFRACPAAVLLAEP